MSYILRKQIGQYLLEYNPDGEHIRRFFVENNQAKEPYLAGGIYLSSIIRNSFSPGLDQHIINIYKCYFRYLMRNEEASRISALTIRRMR